MRRNRLLRAAFGAGAVAIASAGALAIFQLTTPADTGVGPDEYGRALMASGDYRRAAETLRAAYRAAPSETLKIALSQALMSVGDFAGALEILSDGGASAARAQDYLRAEAMLGSERFADAGAVVAGILAQNDADGSAMLLAVRAYYGLGDVESAKDWLARVLRAEGGAPVGAWSFRARLALDANDLKTARAAIARAGEADATARDIALLMAEADMREGEFAAARRGLEVITANRRGRARRIDPQSEYLLARIDAAMGDYRAAARRLRSVRALVAGESHASLVMGLVLERSGDVAQAESELRRSLANAPEDQMRLDALAGFLIRARRYDEADEIVERLFAASPGAGALRQIEILLARGDADGAVALAKEVSGSAPASTASAIAFGARSAAALAEEQALALPRALISMAGVAADAKPAAIRDAAIALSGYKESAALRILAGELYLAAGEDERAQAEFDNALAAAPRSASALVGRVRVDVRGGDLRSAERRLFSILAAETENQTARLALARVLCADGRAAEAAALLRPIAARLAMTRADAALYGALLTSIGASGELAEFADQVRRARPFDPDTVKLLDDAGRLDDASLGAREALLRAPFDQVRKEAYVALMERRGRASEASGLIEALAHRRRAEAEAISSAPPPGSLPPEISLSEARAAYFSASTDPAIASRFGMALEEAGALEEAARVRREAAFWSHGDESYVVETGRS